MLSRHFGVLLGCAFPAEISSSLFWNHVSWDGVQYPGSMPDGVHTEAVGHHDMVAALDS